MNVQNCIVTVKLSRDELWLLATNLEYRLQQSIEGHYNCLQQGKDGEAVFFDREKERLELMKEFYGLHGGHSLHYDSFIRQARTAFQEKREEREAGAKGLANKPE